VIDADVPAFWQRLGLPGLVDAHVHFMPKPVMDAVWRYFDAGEQHFGVAWPVQYRGDDAERVQSLQALGVRTFTALLYPHKPGMAESLNAWGREFAARTPGCVPTATFYAEQSAPRYVREALDAGAGAFKVHVQVGEFDPRDAYLREVWGMIADAGVPVVVHCGSGPLPGQHTGPGPFGAVLAEHPTLTAVIAHFGAPEYAEHAALAEKYDNVHLDTTMVATEFMDAIAPLPRDMLQRYRALQHKIVLGTDFPNIPYTYGTQLAALERLDLGDDWLRAVCWSNGLRLFGDRAASA
jgi:uncharacterized protein